MPPARPSYHPVSGVIRKKEKVDGVVAGDGEQKKAESRQNVSDSAFFLVYFGIIMAISMSFFVCFEVEMRYNIPKSLN